MKTEKLVLTKRRLLSTIKQFMWAAFRNEKPDHTLQYIQYVDSLIDLLGQNVPDDMTFGINFKTCKNIEEAAKAMKESREIGRMSLLLDTDNQGNETQH